MKRLSVATIFLSMTSLAWGQRSPTMDLPPPPIGLIDGGARVDRVLKPGETSAAHRKMLWKDTTADKAGYLRVKSTPAYLDLPLALMNHPQFAPAGQAAASREELNLIGKLAEDRHRDSWAFSRGTTSVMFTVWHYKSAGATVTVSEEFLNQKVDGNRAVLSLSHAENTAKALWKLTWRDEGVMYELYASDILDRGGLPQNKSKDIIDLAALALKRISRQ